MNYRHAAEIAGSAAAAERIVPAVVGLLGPVRTVVDLGGGTGAWCRAFKAAGANRVVCLDHPAARASGLMIDESEFRAADLEREEPDPVPSDLAVSAEFAEHLPADRADWIVEFLTRSAREVLFSAAVPGQGGVGHVNERWPSEWAALFARRGFTQIDAVRPLIVFDTAIPYWYRQNLFLYTADPTRFVNLPRLLPREFRLIHEEILIRLASPTAGTVLRQLGPALWRAVSGRASRLLGRTTEPTP